MSSLSVCVFVCERVLRTREEIEEVKRFSTKKERSLNMFKIITNILVNENQHFTVLVSVGP